MRFHLFPLIFLVAAGGCVDQPAPRAAAEAQPDVGEDLSVVASGPLCEEGPGEVFERRIAPLLQSDRPSSCSKCHAAGVNLAAFVTGDACSSMACLVEQGMVDLDSPYDSKLLEFIDRGYDPDPNTGVSDVMVANEYTGFLEWIEWSAACPEQCESADSVSCGAPDTPLIDDSEPEPEPPELPPLTLEGYPCTEEAQARAFRDYAFPAQSRCGHCHAVNGAIAGVADAPTWIEHKATVFGALGTARNLFALGAIDLNNPPKSRVLLKPLHPDAGGIEHGGGSKFLDKTDELYVDMLQWIRMQAACNLTRATPTPEGTHDKLRDRYGEVPYVQ